MQSLLLYLFNEKKNLIFLVILIPALLVTGPFLPDLSVIILSLFYFYNCILYKKFFFIREKFVILFFFFIIILFFSSILSEYSTFTLKKTFSYLRFLFFSLAILYIIQKNKFFLKYFSKFFIIVYILVLADGYFQFLFGFNTLGNISPVLNRVSGFFGDELILGSYLARLLPLVIFSFFFLKIEKKKIFLIIFLSILLIFLSGERSAFMFSILFFIYLILQIKEFRGYGLISLFFLVILFTSFYFFSPNIKNRINQTIVEFGISKIYKPKYLIEKNLDPQNNVYKNFPGYRIGDLDKKDQQKKIFNNFNFFSPAHENYLYTSLKMFKDSPFFGKGPNTYRIYCADKNFMLDLYSCSTHPHNIYAQLIAETGLFGFLFILLIFFYFMIISIKHFICICFNSDNNKNKLSNLKLCLIASFLIALWPFSPSGNFFNNWLSIINFFPVGFYLSLKYIKI